MVDHRRRRVQDLVEESKHWEADDLIRNFEVEMQRLEKGLGHMIFNSEDKPISMCVSPLPLTPKFETKKEMDEFDIKVHLPNVEKEDIRLYVNRDSVEVRAVSGKKISRPFHLSVETPWSVDSDDAQVEFKNGILTVKARRLKKIRVPVK